MRGNLRISCLLKGLKTHKIQPSPEMMQLDTSHEGLRFMGAARQLAKYRHQLSIWWRVLRRTKSTITPSSVSSCSFLRAQTRSSCANASITAEKVTGNDVPGSRRKVGELST